MHRFLQHIEDFSNVNTRFEAAKKIAREFGCNYLLIFIRDKELDVFLPAQGFPQTLPNGKSWQSFLKNCRNKFHEGILPFPTLNKEHLSHGFPLEDAVVVFVGGCAKEEDFEEFKKVLPLITALLHKEYKIFIDGNLKAFADRTTEKAEKLARRLDLVRNNLQISLQEQERANKEIITLMAKKDEFMNMASHELKTPVSSIKAYLQIITKHPEISSSPTLHSLLHKTLKQTERMVTLINDLLDVSKIQSGQLRLNLTNFSLREVLNECIEQIAITNSTHRIITKGNDNIELYADKSRIEQVITNLISNAVKYSPKAEEIIVETSTDAEFNNFKLSITDFGIGIPADAHRHLFNRFFRADNSATKFAGIGLGLYISSEIIKRHNGKIGVQSKEGEGSTFWFTLPIAKGV